MRTETKTTQTKTTQTKTTRLEAVATTTSESRSPSALGTKVIAFIVVTCVAGFGYYFFGDALSLENLAKREADLRSFQSTNPVLVFGFAFIIYVLVTGLSLPGAAVLTLVYGWYFGMLAGVVLVSFSSTTGATLAFLLSRFIFRDAIQNRFGERLASFNEALEEQGAFFLFTLRLIPAIPFFVINAVMGLTPLRTRTFWWVSQLGMLAGTMVYVYAGASVPDLQTLADKGIGAVFSTRQLTQLLIAFGVLGSFPLVVRNVMKFMSHRRLPSDIHQHSTHQQD